MKSSVIYLVHVSTFSIHISAFSVQVSAFSVHIRNNIFSINNYTEPSMSILININEELYVKHLFYNTKLHGSVTMITFCVFMITVNSITLQLIKTIVYCTF